MVKINIFKCPYWIDLNIWNVPATFKIWNKSFKLKYYIFWLNFRTLCSVNLPLKLNFKKIKLNLSQKINPQFIETWAKPYSVNNHWAPSPTKSSLATAQNSRINSHKETSSTWQLRPKLRILKLEWTLMVPSRWSRQRAKLNFSHLAPRTTTLRVLLT